MAARRCASSTCCSISGKVEGCSFQAFEDATGLRLTDQDGTLREDLPPITTFLNRLLALTIDLQNTLFGVFEDLLRTRIEGAIASGTYDLGVETLTAESLIVDRPADALRPSADRAPRRRSSRSAGASAISRSRSPRPSNAPAILARVLLVNAQSGRAAVQVPAPSLMLDDGEVERRVRLLRPMERTAIPLAAMAQTHWKEADRDTFARAWEAELAEVPAFTESDLHIVTGLLLPIWKRLPDEAMRVYRLQTDDGERDHRPAGLARLGGAGGRRRNADDRASRCLDRGARRPDRPRSPGRSPASPRQGHGRIPRRADRLHRRHGRSAEGDGPHLRDHLLEAAAVRADRREWSRAFSVR